MPAKILTKDSAGNLLFLVDIANLFHSAKSVFGPQARIDFRKLRTAAVGGRPFENILSVAYLAVKDESIPEAFVKALQRLGFEVYEVSAVFHMDGSFSGTNVDVAIAVDAVSRKVAGVTPKTVVVASGDQDYLPVYKVLRERKTRIEVLAFPSSLSAKVEAYVDQVTRLDAEFLFAKAVEEEG